MWLLPQGLGTLGFSAGRGCGPAMTRILPLLGPQGREWDRNLSGGGWGRGTGTESRAISGNCASTRLLATNIPVYHLLARQSPVPDVRGTGRKKRGVPSCHLSVQSHWHWSLTRRLRRALKQRACPPGLLFLLSSPPPLPSPFSSPGSTSTYLPSEVCADMESSWQYTASLSLDMHALRIYFLKIKCICFSLL